MRIHLTQKSIVRRALIGGIALGLLLSAGCQEKILNTPAPEPIQVHLSPLFSSPALNAIVTTWKLTITGDDMEPVVAELEWVDGFVVGEVVNIPAGEDREFTLEGFDAEGNLIYSGVTVATVVSGAIVDVGIDILPVPPLLRFSPPYVELGPPNSITTAGSASLTLKINNTPGLAHLAVSVIYDPVLLALTGIDTGSGEKVIESTVDHFLGVATIDITDLSGNLVDIQGNGELIAMRFQSKLPAPTPDSTEITVSVNDVTADSVTVADIFTDRGFIRLLPSTDTGQNRAPVWASQADTTISEGQTLNLLLTATDPDGTIPALSAVGLPPGGFFQDSGDGSGSFSFTPDSTQAGIYTVTFNASDGALTTSTTVEITVTDVKPAPAPQMPVGFIESGEDSTGLRLAPFVKLGWAPPAGEQSVIGYNVYKRINGGQFNRVTDTLINMTEPDFPTVFIYIEPGIDTLSTDFLQYFVTAVSSDSTESLPSDTVSFVPERLWNADRDLGALVSPQDCGFATEVPSFVWSANPNAASYIVVLELENSGVGGGQQLWLYRQNGTTLTLGQVDGFTYFPLLQSSLTPNALYRFEVVSIDTGNALAGFYESRFWPVGPEGFSGITETDSLGVKIGAIDPLDWCEGAPQGWALNPAFPNPTFTSAEIQFFVPFSQQVAIYIYDGVASPDIANPGGVQVYPAGLNSVTWDLTDRTLSPVPNGVYRCVMVTDNFCCYGDIEVIDAPIVINNPPVILTPIPDPSVNEGDTLQLTVFATDPDFDKVSFSVPSPPPFVSAETGFGGQVNLTITPDFNHAGAYLFDLIASDGSLADTETVSLTVLETNRAPTLDPIGPRSVVELGNLFLPVLGSDLDGDALTFLAENLPLNSVFFPNEGPGYIFEFNPDATQAGVYDVLFIVSDGALGDSELVTITVTDVNQPPIWDPFPDTSLLEGETKIFSLKAVDPEGDDRSLVLTATNLPPRSNFSDLDLGDAEFTFFPDFTMAGVYPVTFIASDGVDSASMTVSFTVRDTNFVPTWTPRNDFTVPEGGNFNTNLFANDPNPAESLSLSAFNLPPNATFVQNLPRTGRFDFSPDFTQAGVYAISFIVSDGIFADTMIITVTVTDSPRAPVLDPIGPQSVTELDFLSFPVVGSDLDGDGLSYFAETLPLNSSFFKSDAPGYIFEFNPDATQAGVYNVLFFVSDGALADSELVTITVTDTMLTGDTGAPDTVSVESVAVRAGDHFAVGVRLFNDEPIAGATLGFSFVTSLFLDSISYAGSRLTGVAGVFDITSVDNESGFALTGFGFDGFGPLPAGDGLLSTLWFTIGPFADDRVTSIDSSFVFPNPFVLLDFTSTQFTPQFVPGIVTVTGNTPPIINTPVDLTFLPGVFKSVDISAIDPDGPVCGINLSASSLPLNSSFSDETCGDGVFSFSPGFDQIGDHPVTFNASDGLETTSQSFTFTVIDTNYTPFWFTPPSDTAIGTGDSLTLFFTAHDINQQELLTLTAPNLPANAAFTPIPESRSARFDFNPDFTQAGVYPISFFVSDGLLADTVVVTITVDSSNFPPVIAPTGPFSVPEGDSLFFEVSASDPDFDLVSFRAIDLPLNATFVDVQDNLGRFAFGPDFTQGTVTYFVTFIASDGIFEDSEIVEITVTDVNRAPIVDPPSFPQFVDEGSPMTFTVFGSDPDENTPALSAFNLPQGAIFTQSEDQGTFIWTPDFTQAGIYSVGFVAFDGDLADTGFVSITVNDVNQAPVITPIPADTVTEGGTLEIIVSASDPDADVITLSALNLPLNATFDPAAGTFTFAPDFTQAGADTVTFIASDGDLADSEVVVITVLNGNQPPEFQVTNPDSVLVLPVLEGGSISEFIDVSDPEGDFISYVFIDLPLNASFFDNDDYFILDFDPDFTQAGEYPIVVIASDGQASDSLRILFVVTDVNRAPAISPIGTQTVTVGNTLNFTISAADPDSEAVTLNAFDLPVNSSFTDNGDGTGSFTFSPDPSTQVGTHSPTFTASDGSLADSQVVVIIVGSADVGAPDTVAVEKVVAAPGEVFPLSIRVFSDEPLDAGTLGFSWGTPDIKIDSVSYTGSRILADAIRSPQSSLDNEIGAALTGFFNTFTPLLPAGDGLWATLWFTASPTAANRVIVIDSAFVAPAGEFVLVDSNGTPFTPEFIPGSVTIAINTPPTIDPIPGPTQVDENMTLSFTVTASDAESVPTLSAVDLPVNASFNDNENGTGSFTFTPDFTQAGVYPVTFIASDGPLADSATVDITVINVNRTPSIPIILKQIAFVGEPYTLVVSSTDPDDDPLVLAANNIPFGALFVDSGNGVGVLTFTPQTSHIQTYDVVFVYSDGFASPSQTVRLSVVQRCALTFFADFALDQINTRPDSTLPGSVVGDSLSAQLPGPNGVVLVRQSVGDMLNKPCEIVDSPLTQGVFLRGFVAPAGLCSYQEVSWQSLVTDNINKFSGCELRDAGGLVIGFLSYTFNGLLITGTAPGSPNITLSAKYTPNVAQNFVIEIDYTNRTITLSVDGETQVATLPFYQSTAGKLATVTFNAQGLFASQQTSLVVDNIQVSGGGGF